MAGQAVGVYNLFMTPRGRHAVALASHVVVGYSLGGFVLGRVAGDTTYGQLALCNEVLRMSLDRLTAALADRYRVERELGQGGMATVYLAHNLEDAPLPGYLLT